MSRPASVRQLQAPAAPCANKLADPGTNHALDLITPVPDYNIPATAEAIFLVPVVQ
jgi:hypothetical protein